MTGNSKGWFGESYRLAAVTVALAAAPAGGALAAIGTPVELGVAATPTSATALITTGAVVPPGDVIAVMARTDSTKYGITGVTDSAGDTCTLAPNGTRSLSLFTCPSPGGLPLGGTITVTFGGSTATAIAQAFDIPGADTANPVDRSPAPTTYVTTTTPSAATGALAQTGDLVLGTVVINSGGATVSGEGSGFTGFVTDASTGGQTMHTGWQAAPSTATVTYAPTLSGSSSGSIGAFAIKAAAPAGGSQGMMLRGSQ